MGLVYRNALANIAATAARDGTVGCFFHRAPNLLEPLVITAKTDNATTHFATQSNASNGLFGAHSPLYQRGWVIQEWYMAPRILHFGRDTVFWECISSAASEAFPAMDDSRKTKTVVELLSKASYRNLDAIQSASELMEAWSKLVQMYSKAQLTHSTDKLPAFSAIAREMAERWARLCPGEEVTYLAGMWSKFLPQQLLWTPTRPNNGWSTAPARPPGRNVAPSWSWVSVDMAVHTANWSPLETRAENNLMDVLESRVAPIGDDPFQEITDGFIRVACFLWKLPRDVMEKCEQCTAQNRVPISLSLRYDERENGLDELLASRDHVYLAPILYQFSGGSKPNASGKLEVRVAITGVILARNNNLRGQYIRIGCFTLSVREMTSSTLSTGIQGATADGMWQYESNVDAGRFFQMGEGYLEGLGLCGIDECDYEGKSEDEKFGREQVPSCVSHVFTIRIA